MRVLPVASILSVMLAVAGIVSLTSCTSETASAGSTSSGSSTTTVKISGSQTPLFNFEGIEAVAVIPNVRGAMNKLTPFIAAIESQMGSGGFEAAMAAELGLANLDELVDGQGIAALVKTNGHTIGVVEADGEFRSSMKRLMKSRGQSCLETGDLLVFADTASELLEAEALAPKIRKALFDTRGELAYFEARPTAGGYLESEMMDQVEGTPGMPSNASPEVVSKLIENTRDYEGGRFALVAAETGLTFQLTAFARDGSNAAEVFASNSGRPNLESMMYVSKLPAIAWSFNFVESTLMESAGPMLDDPSMSSPQFMQIAKGITSIFGPFVGEISMGENGAPEFAAFFESDTRETLMARIETMINGVTGFAGMQFGQQMPPVAINENARQIGNRSVHDVTGGPTTLSFLEISPTIFAMSSTGPEMIAARAASPNSTLASLQRFGSGGVFYFDLYLDRIAAASNGMTFPGASGLRRATRFANTMQNVPPITFAAHCSSNAAQLQCELPWSLMQGLGPMEPNSKDR